MSTYLSSYKSTYLFICLPIYLSIFLSSYLSMCIHICLSITCHTVLLPIFAVLSVSLNSIQGHIKPPPRLGKYLPVLTGFKNTTTDQTRLAGVTSWVRIGRPASLAALTGGCNIGRAIYVNIYYVVLAKTY